MDFSDTPEQAEFRAKVEAWLEQTLPGLEPPRDATERELQSRLWQNLMHDDGWLGLAWPETYGGRGLTPIHEAIFSEECVRRDAPIPVNLLGLLLGGPTIIAHGTDAQKKRYLPKILSAEEIWCQGFSEPGNGSDLAGLRARAVKVPGGWRVTGQKVWTSAGHLAQKCLLLARTDPDAPKHQGITYFLADTEAFDIRPLRMINGEAEFNEMFIDDVYVADEDVLGDVNGGWNVAMTTLRVERSSVAFNLQVWARQALDRLVKLVVEKDLGGDSYVLERIGEFETEVEAIRISTIRSTSAMSAGIEPGAEGSTVKLQWARAVQNISRFALELGGDDFLLAGAGQSAFWLNRYLRARGHSIEGGTDEIQKSIIAERVLGLPRSR
jgi:alkylation response protein AidB-like acyl-CoA dehydrogenase